MKSESDALIHKRSLLTIVRNEWKVIDTEDNAQIISTSSNATQLPEATELQTDDYDQLCDFGIESAPSELQVRDLITRRNGSLDDHAVFCSLFLQDIPESTPAWKRNLFLTCESSLATFSTTTKDHQFHNVYRQRWSL